MRARLRDLGLAILRVAVGGMFLVHGIQKLRGYRQLVDQFPDPLGVGSQASLHLALGAEVGCALLLILGLVTRVAALPPIVMMCIAAFVVHGHDPWATQELAMLYAAAFVCLLLAGPGAPSLDRLLERKVQARRAGRTKGK